MAGTLDPCCKAGCLCILECIPRQSRRRLARRLALLAAVPAAFAAFVAWNGGVVVGDRAAHAPVKHLVQPLYFAAFTAAALAPAAFSRPRCESLSHLRPCQLSSTRRQPTGALA